MFTIILQGLLSLSLYWKEIVSLVLSGLGIGSVLVLALYKNKKLDDRSIYVLLSGWLFLGLVVPIFSLCGWMKTVVLGFFFVIEMVALYTLVKKCFFCNVSSYYEKKVYISVLIFLFFLTLRLSFLQELIFPPFSDSVKHFERFASLLQLKYAEQLTLDTFSPYYHWGFHGIAAWVGAITKKNNPLIMTVVAHFFGGVLPVSIYFMLLSFTDDILSAIFGAFLAGLGWSMPSYAFSFGKYPAFVAISLLPVFLGLFYSQVRHNNKLGQKLWWLYILIVAFAVIWIHSRLIFFLLFFLIAYFVSHFLSSKLPPKAFERGVVSLSFLTIFWILILKTTRVGWLSFEYYLDTFSTTTFLIVILLFMAFTEYTVLVLQWILVIIFTIFATNRPVPLSVYHYPLTVFDQIFFDLIFFLPLSVLGSLGLNGVKKALSKKGYITFYKALSVFLLSVVIINGLFIPTWTPLEGTNYVTEDDVQAFMWIENNTQLHDVFVIASIKKNANYSRASDAGAWINIITGRRTVKIPFQYQWRTAKSFSSLCKETEKQDTVYIYAGHMGTSFNLPFCSVQQGVTPILCFPHARIFSLDCRSFE